jgi:methylmalonyl-CoA mutase
MQHPQPQPNKVATRFAEWRKLVEKDLKGMDFSRLQSRTRDNIIIDPLYAGRVDVSPLAGQGARPWKLVQIVDNRDPEQTNAEIRDDVNRGATGVLLRFATPSRAGLPADAASLSVALADIDFGALHIRLEPHPGGAATALLLRDLILKRGYAPERADIAFGLDPVGVAALHGAEVADASACLTTFRELRRALFQGGLVELDGRIVHEAGGSEVQEVGAILGAAAWWLRRLEASGVAAEDAFACFSASLAVDRDQFLSIAKLRALRLVWRRLMEVCGVQPLHLTLHAATSRRMMTRADPHGNLLRTTTSAFAAAIGGADSISIEPYNAALGPADRRARRLALNTQHLLMQESQLSRVADPGAGSGAIEALTEALAARAWAEFQQIESEGGILQSLKSGAFPARITAARRALTAELRAGKSPLVGATIYLDAAAASHAPRSALSASAGPFSPISLEELAPVA